MSGQQGTSLRFAQDFMRDNETLHANIMDRLRATGWSREDAIREADDKLSRMAAAAWERENKELRA